MLLKLKNINFCSSVLNLISISTIQRTWSNIMISKTIQWLNIFCPQLFEMMLKLSHHWRKWMIIQKFHCKTSVFIQSKYSKPCQSPQRQPHLYGGKYPTTNGSTEINKINCNESKNVVIKKISSKIVGEKIWSRCWHVKLCLYIENKLCWGMSLANPSSEENQCNNCTKNFYQYWWWLWN